MGAKLPPSEVSSKLQPAARAGAVDEGGEGQERVGAVTAVSSGSTIDWSLSKAQRRGSGGWRPRADDIERQLFERSTEGTSGG